jgi:GNAT superfamily N-acetyltransferase
MPDPATAPTDVSVRPIDFARDVAPLRAFLVERDRMRLDHCEAAVRDGDAFIYVVDQDGLAMGWAVVHTRYRDDQDWEPDPTSRKFQEGDNGYLENIEVTARLRSRGVGRQLLEAVQDEARRRGKRALWLHTSENNVHAHRLFEREGWTHADTVYPPWKPAARTRIYKKEL